MNLEWRRFAPLGLYLSLLAALAAAGLYIVQREWNLPLQISLALVVVGLALFAILDPDQVRVALTGRQARYGSNAFVMTLAFTGIIVVINYLAYQNPHRWDMTENQQFTLAPETKDALQNLPQPVTALAFFTPRRSSTEAEGLLDQFKFHGQGNFDYQFINPEADPIAANQANVTRDGTVVLRMGDQQEQVTLVQERELTAAMVRLISPGERKVYFLTGHGEFSPDEPGEQSYSQVKSTLESKNYIVQTLNLLAANQIPDDAEIIVIAGPTVSLSSGEVDQLSEFVEAGGALILLQDPLPLTDFGDNPDPLGDYLAESWGITMGRDIVVDLTSDQLFVAYANRYGDHLITQKMQNVAVFFPTARSVTANSEGAIGANTAELIFTHEQSWAETDLDSLMEDAQTGQAPRIQPDEGVDLLGPVSMAVAAEDFVSSGRIVVFGDADFAANTFFSQYGNGDLLINAVDWATEQEDLINLTPKDNITRMMVPPRPYMMNLILLGSVFMIPGVVLLGGIVVWAQRRRRG